MKNTFKDCYASFENGTLRIGNAMIERSFILNNGVLLSSGIKDLKNGHFWKGIGLSEKYVPETDAVCAIEPDDGFGTTETRLAVTLRSKDLAGREVINALYIYPEVPFVEMSRAVKGLPISESEADAAQNDGVETKYSPKGTADFIPNFDDLCDAIDIPHAHYKIECIKLFDETDGFDTLVKSDKQPLYNREAYKGEGNIVLLTDYEKDRTLMVIKKAPTHLGTVKHTGVDFAVNNEVLYVTGTGFDDSIAQDGYTELYGTVVGIGTAEDIEKLYKNYERRDNIGDSRKHTYIMSNTWGDRNRDGALSHDFMLKEIEAAKELGVDIVQIDDGWQAGTTVNSVKGGGVWGGYYANNADFWSVNTKRFPHGLQPIVDRAAQYGMEVGLWYGPDSANDFENAEKDVETLLHLYNTYGIRYFKLDSVSFKTKRAEQNFLNFMREVHEKSGGRIFFNLDVTAHNRPGYFLGKAFCTIFVENRYTDWCNYYPHSTLRNLWQLSRFFPTRQFQFELLNNRRNTELYGTDALAPINYTIDYEFACTMLANPLVWMEMSHLDPADFAPLRRIIDVYRAHRDVLWNAQVSPIGEEPDGTQFSGFEALCPDGKAYLLLFCENTRKDTYTYTLSRPINAQKLQILASNAPNDAFVLNGTENGLTFTCQPKRTYVFAVAEP